MKLICEVTDDLEYLEEDSNGKKSRYIYGIFMQGKVVNKNKRMYPPRVLEQEVARYNKQKVAESRAYGELGHPDNPAINLDRVSHLITELKKDGNDYYGKAKILETPMGNIVKGLQDGGAKIGVSSRGLGSLKPMNGINEVQDDFKLITAADVVADPSAPNAFVEGIMEDAEWLYDEKHGWKRVEVAENIKKSLQKKTIKEIEEIKLQLFENFVAQLKNNS